MQTYFSWLVPQLWRLSQSYFGFRTDYCLFEYIERYIYLFFEFQEAGGPKIPMKYGRVDVSGPEQCPEEGRLPGNNHTSCGSLIVVENSLCFVRCRARIMQSTVNLGKQKVRETDSYSFIRCLLINCFII